MKNITFIFSLIFIIAFQSCSSQDYKGIKMYKCNPNKLVMLNTPIEMRFFFNREIKDSILVNLKLSGSEVTYEIIGEEIKIHTHSKSIGMKRISGNIQLKRKDEIIKEFDVNEEIMVIEPNALVLNTEKNKRLEINQINKLNISVAGIPIHSLEAKTNNGTIKKEGTEFYLTPIQNGECKIFISGQVPNGLNYETEVIFIVE